MTRSRGQHILNTALLGAVLFIILDRLLKTIAQHIWILEPKKITTYFQLTFVKNYDIAFSLPTIIDPLIISIPLIIILCYYFVQSLKTENNLKTIGLLFIIIGAISNLYDRLHYGYIIDYLDIKYFTVFNLADVMIGGGIILLLLKNSQKN